HADQPGFEAAATAPDREGAESSHCKQGRTHETGRQQDPGRHEVSEPRRRRGHGVLARAGIGLQPRGRAVMGKLSTITDGLMNLVANLGTARDKASHTTYGVPTLTEQDAVNAYRSAWIPRKIVDIPAMDACRKWRGWNAEAD